MSLKDRQQDIAISPFVSNHPDRAPEHEVLDGLIAKSMSFDRFWHAEKEVREWEPAQRILGASHSEALRLVLAMVERCEHLDREGERVRSRQPDEMRRINWHFTPEWRLIWPTRTVLATLTNMLMRRSLPWTEDALLEVGQWVCGNVMYVTRCEHGFAKAVDWYLTKNQVSVECRSRLGELITRLRGHHDKSVQEAARKIGLRLDALAGHELQLDLAPGEAWSDAALLDLSQVSDAERVPWRELMLHCATADGGKPSAKWSKQAKLLLEAVTTDAFAEKVARWFPLVDKPRTQPFTEGQAWDPHRLNNTIIDPHARLLKGLAWCGALTEDARTARALTQLTVSSYRKLPGVGPRLVSLGNACVWALGEMPGSEGVGQLAMLKVKVKFGTAQKLIDKALATTATRLGVPRDEIEEMGVPAYGMDAVGVRREQLGDVAAEVAITPDGGVELRWFKADGKRVKSVPARVKADHAEDLKELKAAAKDIERMLPAQRDRIDSLFLAQKAWSIATWRERYLDHPLVGTLARRLLWSFTDGDRRVDGAWHDGQLVGLDDRPLPLTDAARVELWHPIGRAVDEITAWREWLERHAVKQPFKQAHREVYVLTDAERNTRVYSNRYAAHLLKQHQFNALCGARGWKNKLRLMVDAEYPPASRELPPWGLRAEFWIDGAGEDFGTDTNETGTFLYVATDHVRFYPLDAAQLRGHAAGGGYEWSRYRAPGETEPQPIPLDEVPPLVFSEIMRDVDLFVGVASVGNDANWLDQAARPERRDYWHSYAFGDLSGTAQTRRAVLKRIIPRLKIAPRCAFDDKFLRVRGDLRAYKIHLGSGNILMEPNDQYLCIVPKAAMADSTGGKVFLPFEGDRTLSIILSKAFLLAEDAKITDPTITRQIGT